MLTETDMHIGYTSIETNRTIGHTSFTLTDKTQATPPLLWPIKQRPHLLHWDSPTCCFSSIQVLKVRRCCCWQSQNSAVRRRPAWWTCARLSVSRSDSPPFPPKMKRRARWTSATELSQCTCQMSGVVPTPLRETCETSLGDWQEILNIK